MKSKTANSRSYDRWRSKNGKKIKANIKKRLTSSKFTYYEKKKFNHKKVKSNVKKQIISENERLHWIQVNAKAKRLEQSEIIIQPEVKTLDEEIKDHTLALFYEFLAIEKIL